MDFHVKWCTRQNTPTLCLNLGTCEPLFGKGHWRIAVLAVLQGEIPREKLNLFVSRHGMSGFSPTQGHVPGEREE